MTTPFAPLSTGGAWIKPAEHEGHLVIVANVRAPFGRQYDDMRKAEVDVATFDFVDLNAGGEWRTAVRNSHAGWLNKLGNIVGQPGGMVLARVGKVAANNGHDAWVLAEHSADDATYAGQWVASNPAPPMSTPFGQPAGAASAAAPAAAPAALPSLPAPAAAAAAAPVAAPAQVGPAAPAAAAPAGQPDIASLLAQLQAAQAATQ